MDPHTGREHESVRDEKARLFKAITPLKPADVVRGQYNGYRSVPGVSSTSEVETFVAVRLAIDNWRWAGVPIYIRAGKKLAVTSTEVVVEFKRPPRETFGEIVPVPSSHMRMRISPDISISMGLRVKKPGEAMAGQDVELSLVRQAVGRHAAVSAPAGRCHAAAWPSSLPGRTASRPNGRWWTASWAT